MVDTELIVIWVLIPVGFYIVIGVLEAKTVLIPRITGPVTHCSDSGTDCLVIDPSANPYISVLNS